MGNISVEFSLEQLQALVVLANNQLFRVKYIDPKMPGHVNRPEQLEISKEAVQVVEAALNKAKGIKARNACRQESTFCNLLGYYKFLCLRLASHSDLGVA